MELTLLAFVASGIGSIAYGIWRESKYRAWLRKIGATYPKRVDMLDLHRLDYMVETPFTKKPEKWRTAILIITHKRIAVYQYPHPNPMFTVQPHELRGFWRPVKYTEDNSINDMWIHAQIGISWHILKIRLAKSLMYRLVRTMKSVATDEQIKAYRRRRPYIHRGTDIAFPAQQTLHGSWELGESVNLYIMPLSLVVFRGEEVQQTFDLASVQNIAALRRMEGGKPAGLVRFTVDDIDYAFAMEDYESFAIDLAEASKRTLEDPLERKRKGKDEDDDWDE